jgi:hypothetical protein
MTFIINTHLFNFTYNKQIHPVFSEKNWMFVDFSFFGGWYWGLDSGTHNC